MAINLAKEEITTFLQRMKDIGYDTKMIIDMIKRSEANE